MSNIILQTDSYKIGGHWNMFPKNTEANFAYFESRKGAEFPYTEFFGLQYILKKNLVGQVVTQAKIEEAAALCKAHFGNENSFNRKGWEYILEKHNGFLPIRIKAVPEGLKIPTDNVLMTVESLDNECAWLTNYLESILTHVWYSSTVATLSRSVKDVIESYLNITSENMGGLNFMLHDFGYRGVSSDESSEIGGAAHLVNFFGTDTIPAIQCVVDYYNGNRDYSGIAYSVPATEHSIMTAFGKDGEAKVIENLLNNYPTGILSVVADSYDIYNFVVNFVGKIFKKNILERNGIFVVRPDSCDPTHPTPESLMIWIMDSLWNDFGGIVNNKGFKVINPKVKVLWGDGIDRIGITKILESITKAGFSAENIATFGMGGGLLQKINRDTQRFAFKSSAQKRDGVWFDIQKQPRDTTKASKKGKLKLIKINNQYMTVTENAEGQNILETVFENGQLIKEYSFDEIRANANK